MQSKAIAGLIEYTIRNTIFDGWKHDGYIDNWGHNHVNAVIDGKRYRVKIEEEDNELLDTHNGLPIG